MKVKITGFKLKTIAKAKGLAYASAHPELKDAFIREPWDFYQGACDASKLINVVSEKININATDRQRSGYNYKIEGGLLVGLSRFGLCQKEAMMTLDLCNSFICHKSYDSLYPVARLFRKLKSLPKNKFYYEHPPFKWTRSTAQKLLDNAEKPTSWNY